MARYIDADNLLEKLHRMIDYCEKDRKVNAVSALFQVGDAIMDCKTADVEEVRHGEWIPSKVEAIKTTFICSECNREVDMTNDYFGKPSIHVGKHYPYCHCGARMDLEGVRNEQRTAD